MMVSSSILLLHRTSRRAAFRRVAGGVRPARHDFKEAA